MAQINTYGALVPIPEFSQELTVAAAGVLVAIPAEAKLFMVDVDNIDVYLRIGDATLVAGDVVTRATLLAHDERCRFDREAKMFYVGSGVNVAMATEAGNATVEISFYAQIV